LASSRAWRSPAQKTSIDAIGCAPLGPRRARRQVAEERLLRLARSSNRARRRAPGSSSRRPSAEAFAQLVHEEARILAMAVVGWPRPIVDRLPLDTTGTPEIRFTETTFPP